MPVVLHGFIFMYMMYKIFHFFVYRFLVYDLGMSYGVASIVAFIAVGIIVSFLFGHHRYRSRY